MIRWLVIFCVLVGEIQAGKYHQNDYAEIVNIVQIADYNHSYFSNVKCDLVHYNRSYRAINASLNLKKDLSNLKIDVQIYKFLSNEYRFFPITVSVDGCKELEIDTYGGVEALQPSFNIPLRCPIKKGFLALTYGMVDYRTLPPFMPGGQYKTEAKVYDNLNYVFTLNTYYKVEEFLKKWQI